MSKLSRLKSLSLLEILHLIYRVLQDTWAQMKKAQIFTIASSLAYTTILSIIPLLAVSFAIFNAFGGMQKLYKTLEPLVLENLAQGTSDEVISLLRQFIGNTNAGAIGLGGLVGLILTSMSMLSSAERAINTVWQARLSRGLLQRIYAYWFLITLGPLGLSVAVGFATSSNLPLSWLFPHGTGLAIIAVGIFFFIYKWVPHVTVKSWCAMVGALVATFFWVLARSGYSLYTTKVVSYNKVYGSLGAIPIILLWIYIMWTILLGGAALTAALQKQGSSVD